MAQLDYIYEGVASLVYVMKLKLWKDIKMS